MLQSMSGLLAGAAAIAVFVGTTTDQATNITAADFIPQSVKDALNKGDAVCVNYLAVAEDEGSLRSDWFYVESAGAKDLDWMENAGGMASDNTAGFDRSYLSGNIGAGGGSFSLYVYRNGEDAMVDVVAADYFNEVADILNEGDVILTMTAAGEVDTRGLDFLKVTDITDGVVTVVAANLQTV